MKSQTIMPGATLGVLGGGQLGRMFTLAAHELGFRVIVFTAEEHSPCGQVAHREVAATFDDNARLTEFLDSIKVLTYETENTPIEVVEQAARQIPVRPGRELLFMSQHRLREKRALAERGFPVCDFRAIADSHQLRTAVEQLGLPAVLKTSTGGYDGKGQWLLRYDEDLEQVIAAVFHERSEDAPGLHKERWILEGFVRFDCEFSVVAARGIDGQMVCYGPIQNHHANHILDVSSCPASIPEASRLQALNIARDVADAFHVEGVFCIEFFLATDGRVIINEIAPRPHNSGHLTIDAHVSSQFEQQVRAMSGLPLGSAEQTSPAAMANLLGDLWQDGQPNWAAALSDPRVKLHLYGKREARAGRKMGHLTALAETVQEAREIVVAARARLTAHAHKNAC